MSLSAYELEREENIRRNNEVLLRLGLLNDQLKQEVTEEKRPRIRKLQPLRSPSSRIAKQTKVLNELSNEFFDIEEKMHAKKNKNKRGGQVTTLEGPPKTPRGLQQRPQVQEPQQFLHQHVFADLPVLFS